MDGGIILIVMQNALTKITEINSIGSRCQYSKYRINYILHQQPFLMSYFWFHLHHLGMLSSGSGEYLVYSHLFCRPRSLLSRSHIMSEPF